MTGRSVHSVLLLAIAFLFAPAAYAECECPPDSQVEAILNADRIFRGRVVSAQLSENDPNTIEFVVAVTGAIRGSPEPEYQLTTEIPGRCGVTVRIDFHDVFVLSPGRSDVSRCRGSGRATHRENPLLVAAIELVDLPGGDAQSVKELLSKRLYADFSRERMDDFFDLVEKLDRVGEVPIRLDDRIEYRGVILHFVDDKYDRLEVPQ